MVIRKVKELKKVLEKLDDETEIAPNHDSAVIYAKAKDGVFRKLFVFAKGKL